MCIRDRATIDIFQDAKVPVLIAVATGTPLTQKFASMPKNYIFRVSPRDEIQAPFIVAEAVSYTHLAQFSQPLTGDYQKDLVGNRTRRKFDAPTEIRSARNTTPLLMQTYLRDTGELMCDISMPIYVSGTHWGCVRVGCQTNALLEN